MRKLFVVLGVLAVTSLAVAAPITNPYHANPTSKLLSRALGLSAEDRETRPTGQCIATCDDRMITLRRCPDGECPDYDCRSDYANCGVR